jgi:hypothetical protein
VGCCFVFYAGPELNNTVHVIKRETQERKVEKNKQRSLLDLICYLASEWACVHKHCRERIVFVVIFS